MSTTELYALIGALVAAVLTLAALWVRAQDSHRMWATTKITEHEKVIAVLETSFKGVREDVSEIKAMLVDHTKQDRIFQAAVARKLNIDVNPD